MPSVLIESLECGLDFIEFLGDRVSITDKKELKDIYNSEFKGREGIKDSTFSRVLFALVKFNKVNIKKGQIYINARPQVRVYCDQWRSPRRNNDPQSPSRGPQVSTETPPGTAPIAPVLTPKKKIVTEILHKLKSNRKELTSDKGGIEITSDPAATEGKIHFTVELLRDLFTVTFCISNKGTDCIHFTYYTALHRIRCFTLEDERRVTRACPLFLCPGEVYEVKLLYRLSHYGYFPATLYFEFCPEPPGSVPFCIVREIEAAARTPLAVELGPVAPYKPTRAVNYKPVDTVIVDGVPPESSVTHPATITVKLGDYRYPQYIKDLALRRLEDSEYFSAAVRHKLEAVKNLLDCPLKMKNYDHRFHLLLYLEEIQMEVDIRKYDMHNEPMTLDQSNKKLLVLKVPGVAENRPSVLRGDCLRVSRCEDTVSPVTLFNGYVHRVELERVKLGFSRRLLQTFINNMKFNVEFTINRFPIKMQHRAVELAVKNKLGDVLFPTKATHSSVPVPKLSMFNRQLENNPEQYAAVQRIVAGSSKPAPHLVFGPPGTGKTITLVEAMNQVCRAHPEVHVLACAPSNSACDLLCERLTVHMDPHQVYRLYAANRDPNAVPQQLLKQCNWDKSQDAFVFPKKETLMKYKIVVTTMITAGRLVSGGVPVGHFSYIFVDEGGQAVEPECVISIAGLLSPGDGQLVLAGDPKQLGPILRSPLALQHGLGISLLERLMTQNNLYQKTTDSGHFDTRFVTKLLRNYRSHAAILKVPNEMFYENELQVFADQWERETYCKWTHLPRKGFPIIFHGVMGKDEREANSPSFFNVSEIEVLMDYLVKLIETQGKKGLPKLSAKDIGIIAPYRKQVEKIRKALNSVKAVSQWSDVKELKVGSVEEFQGQERKIIMVSTVRSSINYVKMDKDFNIGFLSNEKVCVKSHFISVFVRPCHLNVFLLQRFNVAVTRARSLLIVVGNPVILNKDPTWNKFISYCVNEKAYTGFDFNDAEGEEEVVSRLASLKICDRVGEESALQRFVDPEWKNEQ